MKKISLSKLLLFIIIISSMNLDAMMCMPTSSGERISLQAEKWTNKFMHLPDRNNYLAAYGLGYGLSLASFAAGKKYLPVMGTVRIKNLSIPVKSLCNITAGYAISYAPLLAYIKSKQQENPEFITQDKQS